MSIEINLWELMARKKINASKLSEITWISEMQIWKIKNWKTKKIELQTIAKLLEAFECTPNDLFKITEDKNE